MPSDAKKREQQRKKDAAKARQAGKKAAGSGKGEEKEASPAPQNKEVTNGTSVENGTTELSAEGNNIIHYI